MAEYDNTNKGALWTKQTSAGDNYLNGKVNVNGVEVYISVFKNNYKDTDTKPDFNISITPIDGVKKAAPKAKEDGEQMF